MGGGHHMGGHHMGGHHMGHHGHHGHHEHGNHHHDHGHEHYEEWDHHGEHGDHHGHHHGHHGHHGHHDHGHHHGFHHDWNHHHGDHHGGHGGHGGGGYRRDEVGGKRGYFHAFTPFRKGHDGPFNYGDVDVFNTDATQWHNPWTRNWLYANENGPPVSDLYGTSQNVPFPDMQLLRPIPPVNGLAPAYRRSLKKKDCSPGCSSTKRGCGCGGNNEHHGGIGYNGGFGLNSGEHSDQGFHGGLHFPLGGWYGWGAWPWGTYGDFVGHHGNAVPCDIPHNDHHLHNSGYDEGEHRVSHGHDGYSGSVGGYGGDHHVSHGGCGGGCGHGHGGGSYGHGGGGYGHGGGGYGHGRGSYGHGGGGYGGGHGHCRNQIINSMFEMPFLPVEAKMEDY